jgi:hypothetical protein
MDSWSSGAGRRSGPTERADGAGGRKGSPETLGAAESCGKRGRRCNQDATVRRQASCGVHRATLNTHHSGCDMQHGAAFNTQMQHTNATCNMQHKRQQRHTVRYAPLWLNTNRRINRAPSARRDGMHRTACHIGSCSYVRLRRHLTAVDNFDSLLRLACAARMPRRAAQCLAQCLAQSAGTLR